MCGAPRYPLLTAAVCPAQDDAFKKLEAFDYAKQKVTRYFGDIPATATLPDMKPNIPKRAADTRETVPDRVPQVRVYRAWTVAQNGSRDATLLAMLSQILGGSATSRLDTRLVYGDKLVDSVSTAMWSAELASTFFIQADVKQGVETIEPR